MALMQISLPTCQMCNWPQINCHECHTLICVCTRDSLDKCPSCGFKTGYFNLILRKHSICKNIDCVAWPNTQPTISNQCRFCGWHIIRVHVIQRRHERMEALYLNIHREQRMEVERQLMQQADQVHHLARQVIADLDYDSGIDEN